LGDGGGHFPGNFSVDSASRVVREATYGNC
jgi:hypothetical protein